VFSEQKAEKRKEKREKRKEKREKRKEKRVPSTINKQLKYHD